MQDRLLGMLEQGVLEQGVLDQGVLDLFQRWVETGRLLGWDTEHLMTQVHARSQDLQDLTRSWVDGPGSISPTVLLAESDPSLFLAGFISACAHGCSVCLGNPTWTDAEWQQVFEQIQPQIVFGKMTEGKIAWENSDQKSQNSTYSVAQPGWILIPTGGSSGKIRFVVHTWETLTASVQGFQAYFGVDRINACCTLPLYHVSGLMQLLRSLLTDGKLAIVSSKSLETKTPDFDPSEFF
ncbi:MAG: hypothetical protein HC772_19230, partial [Leptolyngbyaceae cyanobacterium CRU_2_3]|nr:hypothetical protein [Leptolyngbyaceae cyanobacterium CRU_2_3]